MRAGKKKKCNDESKSFEDWTTKKLKEWAVGLHQSIYEIECYGSKDIQNYYGVVGELERRGISVNEKLYFGK